MRPIVSLRNVCAGYDGRTQLRDATLSVSDGEFVGIKGPNGGGKTTLVRVMLGLLRPMSGTVEYRRCEPGGILPRMGYLPQYSAIDREFPLSALDVVLTGLAALSSPLGFHARQHRQKALEAMASTGVAHLAERHIKALSGGQLQRVLMARALVTQPQLLVLDEPDTYIDAAFRSQMHSLLDQVRAHCAIVMVSHDTDYLASAADKLFVVNETVEEEKIRS